MLRPLMFLLAGLLCVASVQVAEAGPEAPVESVGASVGAQWLDVQAGQSLVWPAQRPIARLLLSDPEVAEVKLLEEEQFQVRGLAVGTTDLWVWYRDQAGGPVEYKLAVHQDLAELLRRTEEIVGDAEPPAIYPMHGHLVLDGKVADVETLERLTAVARIYDPEFVNLMSVGGDHQVQLRVVFAEVSRTGLRELGVNALFTGSRSSGALYGPNYGDTWTLQGPDGGTTEFNMPTTGAFQMMALLPIGEAGIAAFLGALEEANLSKILAQPTLVALSGQQAEFLAGGEIPIPITTYDRVQVEFKEYGIKLSFVPTVLAGQVVDLRVYTEVSEIDHTVSISLGGVGIPGLLTRKGSSHLRLRSGTTFAMAGLLSETIRNQRSEFPLLGRIPILGALFRYVRHETEQTEIMIFVTPEIVRPLEPGEVPPLPTSTENNHPTDLELFLLGKDHHGALPLESAAPLGMER
ncbi:MAG: pilus assembly protein N-terminal domain-containing protein [Pseudomonadota bacterium]